MEESKNEGMDLTDVYAGKFLGPNKIASVAVLDFKTALGSVVFEVVYEDGRKEVYPEKSFGLLVSSEAKDFNHLRDTRVDVVVPKILELIEEYDFPFEQFTWLMTQVAHQWQNKFNRANAILWFGSTKEYFPGSDTMDRLTLIQAERVNRSVPTEENAG